MPKSWNMGDTPGAVTASVAKPKMLAKMISNAKSPVLVVGPEVLESEEVIKRVAEISKTIPVIATAHTSQELEKAGIKPILRDVALHELTNYMQDEDWKVNGHGPFKTVIYIGVIYYLGSRMLDSLKCFGTHLKRYSIDRYYHVNASVSLDNLYTDEKYLKALDEFIENLEK